MANLTETQVYFRKAIIGVVIAAFLFYTGRFLVNGTVSIVRYLFPAEIPPPEAAFKTLPALKMTSVKIEGTPTYVLDTENGALPAFPDRLEVYAVKDPQANLLSEQTVKNLATDLKFDNNFVKMGTTKLKWTDGTNNRSLTADIVSRNFQVTTGVEKLNTIVNQSLSIRNTDAEEDVIAFIKSKNLVNSRDVDALYTVTTPSMIVLGRLKESKIDPQRSKLMKVDVFRELVIPGVIPPGSNLDPNKVEPLAKYKILGPNPKNSLINFYVTNADDPFKTPIINYTYWDVDYNTKSEYGLTPIGVIWNTIAQNAGVVAYLRIENEDYFESFKNNLKVNRVEIKDIYLAYYESNEYQKYLQPIYVFEGTFATVPEAGKLPQRGEIILYYPAVSGENVQ